VENQVWTKEQTQGWLAERVARLELPEGWAIESELIACPNCGEPVLMIDVSNKAAGYGAQAGLHSDSAEGHFEDFASKWEAFEKVELPKILSKVQMPNARLVAFVIPASRAALMDLLRRAKAGSEEEPPSNEGDSNGPKYPFE
jgi:hypothetical protein